jgi:hypothetical protein
MRNHLHVYSKYFFLVKEFCVHMRNKRVTSQLFRDLRRGSMSGHVTLPQFFQNSYCILLSYVMI